MERLFFSNRVDRQITSTWCGWFEFGSGYPWTRSVTFYRFFVAARCLNSPFGAFIPLIYISKCFGILYGGHLIRMYRLRVLRRGNCCLFVSRVHFHSLPWCRRCLTNIKLTKNRLGAQNVFGPFFFQSMNSTLYLYLNFGSTNKWLCVFVCLFLSKYFEKIEENKSWRMCRENQRYKHDGPLIGSSQLDIETSDEICSECCYVIIAIWFVMRLCTQDSERSKTQTTNFSTETWNRIYYRLFALNALKKLHHTFVLPSKRNEGV